MQLDHVPYDVRRLQNIRNGVPQMAWCNADAAKAARNREAEIQMLIATAGLAKSSSISWDQLAGFLAHVVSRKGPAEYTPSDEDTKWLIVHVTRISKGQMHSWQDWRDNRELQVELKHVAQVLPDYLNYLAHAGMIDEVFNRFDKRQSGVLEKDELKQVLAELNDAGIADQCEEDGVSDELVDRVMQEADVTQDSAISKLELKCAIAAWFAHSLSADQKFALTGADGKLTKSAAEDKSREGLVALTQGGSACCVLQ